ncbi:GNAT family N-acetyltransferase [bacterium]|nr:GNAT family N-acetyltransferase [bacterium]
MAIDCPSSDALSSSSIKSPEYVTVTVSQLDANDSLFVEWERLAGSRLFLAPGWLMTWWKHYREPGDQLHLITVRDTDGWLIGLAPWFKRQTWWGGNEIRFLGTGEVCSDYLSILAKPGEDETVVNAVSHLLVQGVSHIDRIFLEGIESTDQVMQQFATTMSYLRYDVRHQFAMEGYRLPLPGDWDDWLAQLSKSRRHRVRQLWRNQFDTGRAVLHMADGSTLPQAFQTLVDLHQQRRNQMGQPGCFASQRFHDFLLEAAHIHLKSGQLRLQWVEMDGEPIAAEFDLEAGTDLLHYCSGISVTTSFNRPGWLGITAAIRHAIESGKTNFDFLRGDEEYKSHWRGQPVSMFDLELIPPRFTAQARNHFRSVVKLAKRQAKRFLVGPEKPAQPATDSSDDA